MDPKTPIENLMTLLPHTVGSEQPLAYAQAQMKEHGIRHLPVLHGGALDGILSERDLALAASLDGIDPATTKVEEAMTAVPYAIGRKTPVAEVVREMADHKYGSALIVEGKTVVGIFTVSDAVAHFARVLESTEG
ncbi:MAG TPA: CBS domain-containing protein [Polyangiaceae bacterium]|nr:CBS domain-containing protein [Polyangiaceae bacterium]